MRFLYLLLLLSEWFFEGFAPKPGPPTDLRILPLSNTELDVDIYPPDTGNKVDSVVGEPTRYNISYEFRMWKSKTNVQELILHQTSGVVMTTMRMINPGRIDVLVRESLMEAIDYVYSNMRVNAPSSDAPVALGTCQNQICSMPLASSYELVFVL